MTTHLLANRRKMASKRYKAVSIVSLEVTVRFESHADRHPTKLIWHILYCLYVATQALYHNTRPVEYTPEY